MMPIPANVLLPLQAVTNGQVTSARKLDLKTGGTVDSTLYLLPAVQKWYRYLYHVHVHLEGCFLFNPKALDGLPCLQLDCHPSSSAVTFGL